VMIAEAINITQEAYFSILLDRKHLGPVMVASPDGGMDIEAVAEKTPERIFQVGFL
jgi:succinyl-CoA synthetase beta subunit